MSGSDLQGRSGSRIFHKIHSTKGESAFTKIHAPTWGIQSGTTLMNVNNTPISGHGLMLPPPGYKFIPKNDRVCDKSGCFECYDIYCQRCESKDRRILELEMRNNEMAKYIAHLSSMLFPRGEEAGNTPKTSGMRTPNLPTTTSQKVPH